METLQGVVGFAAVGRADVKDYFAVQFAGVGVPVVREGEVGERH